MPALGILPQREIPTLQIHNKTVYTSKNITFDMKRGDEFDLISWPAGIEETVKIDEAGVSRHFQNSCEHTNKDLPLHWL